MEIITLINDYVSGLLEAEEDHIHRQKDGEMQGCFMGKLIYVFEGKEEVCKGRGHVSSVYSERMTSRPMGWSETRSDRMCKLRCYIRNYGREKVIDLVKYRRERELGELPATGTDGMIEEPVREKYTAHQHEMQRYAESMYAELVDKRTVWKILAIREQLGSI